MAFRPFLLAACLTLTLASGCATNQSADLLGAVDDDGKDGAYVPSMADPWPRVQEHMADVPCEATVEGQANSPNLKQLATISIPDSESGIHAELDLGGRYAVHARYGSSGFEIYDLWDPLSIVHIGNWTNTDASGEPVNDGALDVKFSPDNMTVLVGGRSNVIHLVDVRDPLHPMKVGDWDLADAGPAVPGADGSPHMLYTARIADQDWVFIAPNDNSGIWILKMQGDPGNRTLEYVAQTLPVEGGPLGPHDLYAQQDELDGNWYLYSADGFHGWTVFNINDPANPMPAGGIVNPAELSYTHTIQAQMINGKRIVATIGEIGVNLLRVYDATILQAPILLGVWEADVEDSASPQHNLNFAGGYLYVSYYSHGTYAFDIAALTTGPSVPIAGTVGLEPAAHWAVEGEDAGGGPLAFRGYWDTVVKDGIIYVSHIEGGLIVLGFGCNDAPNPLLTSDG